MAASSSPAPAPGSQVMLRASAGLLGALCRASKERKVQARPAWRLLAKWPSRSGRRCRRDWVGPRLADVSIGRTWIVGKQTRRPLTGLAAAPPLRDLLFTPRIRLREVAEGRDGRDVLGITAATGSPLVAPGQPSRCRVHVPQTPSRSRTWSPQGREGRTRLIPTACPTSRPPNVEPRGR